jgi:hypothetical protein
LKKKIVISLVVTLFSSFALSQKAQFSFATDVSLLRSFKKEQRFWAIGQTIVGHLNLAPEDGLFVWLAYYSPAQFSNYPTATAKDINTIPQQIDYMNRVKLRIKHFSIGWKHYLKGAYNIENNWSLYGYGGFGILFANVVNQHSVPIDTANYNIPVMKGTDNFKRLTIDLGLGYEKPIGGDIYFYAEARTILPTTDYPTNYLLVNKKAPRSASVNMGLRILFD